MRRTLEICSGPNQSFTCAVAKHFDNPQLTTTDIKEFPQHTGAINYVCDFSFQTFPKNYDMVWASLPCNTYSIAGIRHHRRNAIEPISAAARSADMLGEAVVKYILRCLKHNSNFKFVIENPRGCLRKMPFMKPLEKYLKTVTYCQYGDFRMKPTDLWTNVNFEVRMCKNGDPCHESSPRGSMRGTSSLSWEDRCKIPEELLNVILKEVKK